MGHMVRHRSSFPPACGGDFGKAFGHINKYILQMGGTGRFSAHPLNGASPAACGFLALIAKHLIFH